MPSHNEPKMDEISNARLWKSLDSISDRLSGIERRLEEVVRLEERVNTHTQMLSTHESRSTRHDRRIHDAELWQASYGDKSSVERMVADIKKDIEDVKDKVEILESEKDISKGHKDISKQLAAILISIFVGYVLFKITSGN